MARKSVSFIPIIWVALVLIAVLAMRYGQYRDLQSAGENAVRTMAKLPKSMVSELKKGDRGWVYSQSLVEFADGSYRIIGLTYCWPERNDRDGHNLRLERAKDGKLYIVVPFNVSKAWTVSRELPTVLPKELLKEYLPVDVFWEPRK